MAWARFRYRGNKVWVAVDDAGAPVLDERRLARVRYREDDDREYTVRPAEISALDAPAPGAEAGPAPSLVEGAPPSTRFARSGSGNDPPSRESREPPPEAASTEDGEEEPFVGDDVPALAGLAIHAYTDGAASGNPGPAGIGVILLFREHRKEVSKYLGETTNNVAELTAVLEALRLVKRRDLPVRVHVDSSYAIGVSDGSMRPKANRELVERIHAEMRGFSDLAFVKVAGHSGHELNDRADALAREAIRKHRPR